MTLWQDLRYAVRMLRRERGFTIAAVLTLALGIGANAAIFALVDATLLRPLPFPAADRLVMLWERSETTSRGRVASLNLLDWNTRNRSFEAIGGFVPNVGGMVMTGSDGLPETIARQWVTADFFNALGVRPIAGRTFNADDDRQRRSAVVFTEALWRSRFNGDPAIVGRDLRLDGSPWTVVGIVPDEAQVFGRTGMWGLFWLQGRGGGSRTAAQLQTVGRLKPGVALDAAAADLAAVADGLAREYPRTNQGRSVTLAPLHDTVIGAELRRTSLLFLAVVGLVLLICCANVANLLLTRASARRRELAIRSALGADRGRVIRQLLTESLLLSIAGGLLGLVAGAAMLRLAPSVMPQDLLSAAVTLTFNMRVVVFCAVTAVLVGVVFGLAPAWQATALASAHALGSGSRTTTARSRTRELLVVAEVALAVTLLVGAGLLLRTLIAVEQVDRGYEADSALTMIVDPPFGGDRLLPFYQEVEREISALPGVRGVAWATTLPMGRSYLGQSFVDLAGEAERPASQRPAADFQIVSASYFRTLGIPIVAGRSFNEHDRRESVAVCLVNEGFVRRYLPGRSPVGLRVATRSTLTANAEATVREIVGVVRQVKNRPDETEDFAQLYVPLAQNPTGDIYMIVRPAAGRADALAPAVRRTIARLDPDGTVSVRSIATLEEVAAAATARHRFRAVLVVAFAGLALLLAMVGLFGILAYAVQQRVREFGVRRALGATTGDVLRLVVGQAVRVTTIGAVIGLTMAAWLGRGIATMLFGVDALDSITFGLAAAVLVLTAVVSVSGPAWRATRVDPAVALRSE